MPIQFYFDDVKKPKIFVAKQLKIWLKQIEKHYLQKIETLTYVFVNDEKLLSINQQFLQHNTFTDIITFNFNEHQQNINGEIYISLERIQENAQQFKVDFSEEMLRVMAHGFLHLIGYKDKSKSDKIKMKAAEDFCVNLYFA